MLAMQNTKLDMEIIDRMGPKENRKHHTYPVYCVPKLLVNGKNRVVTRSDVASTHPYSECSSSSPFLSNNNNGLCWFGSNVCVELFRRKLHEMIFYYLTFTVPTHQMVNDVPQKKTAICSQSFEFIVFSVVVVAFALVLV